MIVRKGEGKHGGPTGRGRSFKGLAAYLTDPKADQDHRALWSSVENVGTDDPALAARIMAHTAMNAESLKDAARERGEAIPKGGRKTTDRPVYHVVLSWAADENPSPEQQQAAARDLLKSLGLDRAQCVMVAHDDNGLPHVHLMVNLIDPSNGLIFKDPTDPHGKKNVLSNDQDKMEAWALAYERANGGVRIESRVKREAQREAGQRPDRAPRMSRAAFEAHRQAQRAAFDRQATERGDQRRKHGEEWAAARIEAAAHKAAYGAAFRAAHAQAKAADKAENKPQWRELFQRQAADRQNVDRQTEAARVRAEQARRAAKKAATATSKAERRSRSVVGAFAQRIGIAATPELAQVRQLAAAEQMKAAALELAKAELVKASLAATHEAQRKALGKALGNVTFAKAQLAVDEMPRTDFAALVNRQAREKAALVELHNAERDELGMKRYEPKTSRKDDTMSEPQLSNREARPSFAVAADKEQRERSPTIAQGAQPTLRPDGSRGGGSVGAPVTAREQDNTPDPDRQAERPTEAFNPRAAARERINSPEAKAERQRQAERDRERDRGRDDFER